MTSADHWKIKLLDHPMAAGFSLWRAAFLAGEFRTFETIQKAQKAFLSTVIATNSITFPDDRKNSAWTYGFYLENAHHRLVSAHEIFKQQFNLTLDDLLATFKITGLYDVRMTQFERESAHAVLRTIMQTVHPKVPLDVEIPKQPADAYSKFFEMVNSGGNAKK